METDVVSTSPLRVFRSLSGSRTGRRVERPKDTKKGVTRDPGRSFGSSNEPDWCLIELTSPLLRDPLRVDYLLP